MPKSDTKTAQKVGEVMHEFKEGELKSSSGKPVRKRKQAIAIGLSEARKAGGTVSTPPRGRSKSS